MSEHPIRSVRLRSLMMGGAVLAMAAAGIAYTGISSRAQSEADLTQWTDEQAIPTVSVVQPTRGQSSSELVLPGTIQAFTTASLYPRATGYIKSWSVDIGAHVKAGQVLASIESPDLDQQLQQARFDLASAESNAKLAAATAQRWSILVRTNIVSQQATDEKSFDASAKAAAVQAAKANVARLEDLSGFKSVTAPFDGVVTARNTDVGDLVSAGSTSSRPLFEVADTHRMRIYVHVPQAFLRGLKPGLKATLDLPQYPGHPFDAVLVSTANAVSEDTRTALVEFQADNLADQLWPGTFAEVHITVPSDPNILEIPATALVFGRQGMKVALLGKSDKVTLTAVTLGRNLGSNVEIRSGLSTADRIVDHPSEALESGDSVRLAGAPSATQTTHVATVDEARN